MSDTEDGLGRARGSFSRIWSEIYRIEFRGTDLVFEFVLLQLGW